MRSRPAVRFRSRHPESCHEYAGRAMVWGQQGRSTLERTDFRAFSRGRVCLVAPDNWTVRGAYGVFDQVWAGANYGGGWGQGGTLKATKLRRTWSHPSLA